MNKASHQGQQKSSAQNQEYCVRFQLPKNHDNIKIHEIYRMLMPQVKLNILAIYQESSHNNEPQNLTTQKCLALIQDFVVKSNRHLVTNSAKLTREMYEIVDPHVVDQYEKNPTKFSLGIQKANFIDKIETEEQKKLEDEEKLQETTKQQTLKNLSLLDHISLIMDQKNPHEGGNAYLLLIYDRKQNFDNFMINDSVVLFEKLVIMKEVRNSGFYTEKFAQSHQGLYFKEYSVSYQDFDIGIFHADLFRQYWSLQNVQDAGYYLAFKKAFFHTRNPENSTLESLLTLDLLFQVEKKLEIRISIDFYHVEVYVTENKVHWIISLSQPPACYFCPLESDEYLASHIKSWKRLPNFFTEAMMDNIDKLYVANKSVLRLQFDITHYNCSKFFQSYEKRLSEIGKLGKVYHQNYKILEYSKTPLNLTTKIFEKSKVPFHMKFLTMVMISNGQVDVYDLPKDFLDKYWDGERDKENWQTLLRNTLEMFIFNREFDKTYLSYNKFKEINKKYLKAVKLKEKLFDVKSTENKNLFTFDGQIYNFQVQITPTCMYYLCNDIDLAQTILFKFPEHVERFLLVKFIDENLQPNRSVKSILGFYHYKKFIENIKLLGRSYEFFSFNSSQVQDRAFWTFYSDEKIKASTLLGYIESQHFKSSSQSISPIDLNMDSVSEYINKVSDQLKNSYDIFDLKKDGIQVLPLILQNAVQRYVTLTAHTKGLSLRKYTYEGYISEDLLEEISAKFCLGNLPGLILRSRGQDFLVIRNPNSEQKRSLYFYEDVFNKFDLDSVKSFEIVEIPHYRPAFLNKYLIKLFEVFFGAWSQYEYRNNTEYLTFVKGIQTVLSRFSEHVASDSVELFKRVIFSSKYANSVLNPILSTSKYFSQDLFFRKLRESMNIKVNYDISSKLKINTEYGAYLLGIVDDTGNLKQGEVYYQIDNPLEKAPYEENLFPFVVIVRKPYMEYTLLDQNINSSDIRVFSVSLIRYLRNDAYKNLKNCIVFSHEDKEFVLNSCANIQNIKRSNYFHLFWDQHLIPERFQKKLNPLGPGPLPFEFPQKKDQDHENTFSSDFNFNESFLPFDEYNNTTFSHSDTSCDIKFNRFKLKMMNSFLKLIKNPRMKDLKNLHLAYADLPRRQNSDKNLLPLISYCYREFNINNPLSQLQKENATFLLNILESSKYLPVHNYNKEIKSTSAASEETLLSKIYSIIMLSESSLLTTSAVVQNKSNNINPLLIYKGYEKYIKHGFKVLILYKYDIQRLCFLYNCSNESDLFIGFNKRNKLFAKELKANHFSENTTHLKDYIRALTQKYKQLFSQSLKTAGVKNANPLESQEALSQASAWYLCSLYHFWKDDPRFIGLTQKEEFKNLLIGLEYFDIQHVYGLPWIAASNLLNNIRLNNISINSISNS